MCKRTDLGSRLLRSFWVLLALLALPSASPAGPNAGGALVLHCDPQVVYSAGLDYCGSAIPADCRALQSRVDGKGTYVLTVLAAFPPESQPCLIALVFGIEYDPTIEILGYGHCGDRDLTDDGWPASGTGVAIAWNENRYEHLVEVCWLAAYDNHGEPALLQIGAHPTQGGYFVEDCTPIQELDPIEDYGRFGFNTEGYLPCPGSPTPTVDRSWGVLKHRHH